jgi:hypothetical protein
MVTRACSERARRKNARLIFSSACAHTRLVFTCRLSRRPHGETQACRAQHVRRRGGPRRRVRWPSRCDSHVVRAERLARPHGIHFAFAVRSAFRFWQSGAPRSRYPSLQEAHIGVSGSVVALPSVRELHLSSLGDAVDLTALADMPLLHTLSLRSDVGNNSSVVCSRHARKCCRQQTCLCFVKRDRFMVVR